MPPGIIVLPGRDDPAVHAAIYRLRRRIEQVTPVSVPLRAEARVGHTFRGRMLRA